MKNKYTYFWRFQSPFSQHYAVKFNVEGQEFNCAEQFYMFQKASAFDDYSSAEKILRTKNPTQQKSLGRKVKNFNPKIWDNISRDVVYKGNIHKFEQNENLMNLLLATEGTTLVEASPKDKIWGVGLDASDSMILDEITWRGTNKLGYILSQLREDLLKDGRKYNESIYTLKTNNSDMSFSESSSPFHPKHMAPFSIDQINFCSLHQYLSFMLSPMSNKAHGPKITDQKKLFYKSDNPKFVYHCLLGNYYKFNENLNLKAQLLDTAGKQIIFIDADKFIGSKIYSNKKIGQNILGKSLTVLRDLWLKHGQDVTVEIFLQEFENIEKFLVLRGSEQISQVSTSDANKKNMRCLTDDTSVDVSAVKKLRRESNLSCISNALEEWVEVKSKSPLQSMSNESEKLFVREQGKKNKKKHKNKKNKKKHKNNKHENHNKHNRR